MTGYMQQNSGDQLSIDHRDILGNLSDEQRHKLGQLSDRAGLIQLAGHVGLIALFGIYIVADLPFWPVLLLPLGVCLIFLFTLLHECIHETPFATPRISRIVARICGFILFIPPKWFHYFHMAHHRHTHDPEKDPELAVKKPESWPQYIAYISGMTTWYYEFKTLTVLVAGRSRDQFVPAKAHLTIVRQARMFLLVYRALALASIITQSAIGLWIWIIPLMLGQPFLRAYLLAEHGRCPHVANMLDNTRTTYTTKLIRFLAWNMPYHTEHHTWPIVPFYKLPELHEIMRPHLRHTENGYGAFHVKYLDQL